MSYMVTKSGAKIFFLAPENSEIDEVDIAISLTNIRRYSGGVVWSLAQHLQLCEKLAESWPIDTQERERLCQLRDILKNPGGITELLMNYAFLHDVPEAYLGDVVTGLKQLLPEYIKIENIWDDYIHGYFQRPLKYRPTEAIKQIDRRALLIETYMLNHAAHGHIMGPQDEPISVQEMDIFSVIQWRSPSMRIASESFIYDETWDSLLDLKQQKKERTGIELWLR